MSRVRYIACQWCGRKVVRRWYHRFLDPHCGPERAEVDRCHDIAWAMLIEPPPEIYWDPPPDDIDVCPDCEGSGEVFVRRDWETGAYITADCASCGTTGKVDPLWQSPLST